MPAAPTSVPPDTAKPYRQTPVFTEATVPAGLRKDHMTKAGVWGVIHVLSGELRFSVPGTGNESVLGPGRHPVITPATPHHVTPLGSVSFYVECWR